MHVEPGESQNPQTGAEVGCGVRGRHTAGTGGLSFRDGQLMWHSKLVVANKLVVYFLKPESGPVWHNV